MSRLSPGPDDCPRAGLWWGDKESQQADWWAFIQELVKGLHWEGKSWDMVASLSCLHLCFLLNHVCAILGTCVKQASHGCSACVVAAGLSR